MLERDAGAPERAVDLAFREAQVVSSLSSRPPLAGTDAARCRARADALVKEYRRLRPSVMRSAAAKLRDRKLTFAPEDLDEAYNAAWFALYQAAVGGEEIENPSGWLVQAIVWRGFNETRRIVARPKLANHADFDERAAVFEPDYAADADERALLRNWRTGLRKRLRPQERQAAALRIICGYSRDEIAGILGIDREKTDKLLDSIQAKTKGLLEVLDGGDACQEHRSLIAAYAHGVLDPDGERFAVARQHLLECPACAATVRAHRNLCILVPAHVLVGLGVVSKGGLLGFFGGLLKGSGAGTATIGVSSAGAGTAGGMLGGGLGTVGNVVVCALCAGGVTVGASTFTGSGESNAGSGQLADRPAAILRAPASSRTTLSTAPAMVLPPQVHARKSTSSASERRHAKPAHAPRPAATTSAGPTQEFSIEAPSTSNPSTSSAPAASQGSPPAPEPSAPAPKTTGGEFSIEY